MARYRPITDPRVLEIGQSAYLLHYRINGEDYILRLWQGSFVNEMGRPIICWQCRIRTETGDWSNIVPCSPEYINNRRGR